MPQDRERRIRVERGVVLRRKKTWWKKKARDNTELSNRGIESEREQRRTGRLQHGHECGRK